MHRCRVWAGGFAPEITHQRGQKSTFIDGNGAKAKTVPHVTLGFPEYGMTNGSNFRWGIPHATNPQKVRKRGMYL